MNLVGDTKLSALRSEDIRWVRVLARWLLRQVPVIKDQTRYHCRHGWRGSHVGKAGLMPEKEKFE